MGKRRQPLRCCRLLPPFNTAFLRYDWRAAGHCYAGAARGRRCRAELPLPLRRADDRAIQFGRDRLVTRDRHVGRRRGGRRAGGLLPTLFISLSATSTTEYFFAHHVGEERGGGACGPAPPRGDDAAFS